MAYSGPWIAKLVLQNGNYYLSRGRRRLKIDVDRLAYEALVSAKETHEGDNLLEHWVDGKWQQRKTT